MTQSLTAKVFANGRSQAVRLPAAFRFDVPEVFVRQDPKTGDIILSRRPADWQSFVEVVQHLQADDPFLSPAERAQAQPSRDPLAD